MDHILNVFRKAYVNEDNFKYCKDNKDVKYCTLL